MICFPCDGKWKRSGCQICLSSLLTSPASDDRPRRKNLFQAAPRRLGIVNSWCMKNVVMVFRETVFIWAVMEFVKCYYTWCLPKLQFILVVLHVLLANMMYCIFVAAHTLLELIEEQVLCFFVEWFTWKSCRDKFWWECFINWFRFFFIYICDGSFIHHFKYQN